jgi:hypothetical protein
MQGAVDMVDKNRLKFPHIKDAELGSRKKFVDDMFVVINAVKSSIESAGVRYIYIYVCMYACVCI